MNPSLIHADDQESDDPGLLPAGGANGRVGGGINNGMNAYPGLRTGTLRPGSGRARRHISRLQRAAAALIAGACVFAAAWYVPGIVAADGRSLTGTVTSDGIIYLNFAGSGQLAAITARAGQVVRKGQLLATQAEPAVVAVKAADRAAITADQAQVAAALAAGASPAIATAKAQLAKRPLFSLFPEGPQSSVAANGSNAAAPLPVIALRTSSTWQVTVLVPETSVKDVRPGQAVTIDVPAAGITAVPGRVAELLSTPVVTSQGVAYQAVVSVLGRPDAPPTGMAANVQLGP